MIRKMLIAAAALVVLAAAPAAAQYDFGVSPGTLNPGGTFTVSGNGCEANAPVTITVFEALNQRAPGDVILTTTTTTDDEGRFSIDIQLPADTPPGTYTVEARCPGQVFSDTIQVVPVTRPEEPGGGVDDGDIVRTGSDLNGLGLIGAGLLTVGGLVLIASKRRTADA